MRMLIVVATGWLGRTVVAAAQQAGHDAVARAGSALEVALSAGPNLFTVVRPSVIAGPGRGTPSAPMLPFA